ncbi:DurN family substrate-assisted peptide maturase [Actinoallomurus sp. NPDC052274]|uniref:DurN family substrate-assisted peptide maturase n=1 Tax=Actinoallomurus sp. NPDC052274 TaxID=3155420 RepID=UPI00344AF505
MGLKGTGPKPPSDLTKHRAIETVRQIQHLMLLCALLPPDGRLQEVLRLALSLHEEPLLARMTPVTDLHPQTTKEWLESLWIRDGISAEEEEMIAWQNDKPNMDAAIAEIKNAERQLGIRLATELVE